MTGPLRAFVIGCYLWMGAGLMAAPSADPGTDAIGADSNASIAALKASLERHTAAKSVSAQVEDLLALAREWANCGQSNQASLAVFQALALARGLKSHPLMARAHLMNATLKTQLGDRARGLSQAAKAVAEAQAAHDPELLRAVAVQAAHLDQQLGDPDRQFADLKTAQSAAGELRTSAL